MEVEVYNGRKGYDCECGEPIDPDTYEDGSESNLVCKCGRKYKVYVDRPVYLCVCELT